MFDKEIIGSLKKSVKGEVSLEVPPDPKLGDFAFPCFSLAKEFKKNPVQIAQELAKSIHKPEIVETITATGPYVNFFLNSAKVARYIVQTILKEKKKFGSSDDGKGKLVAIEFSSPNIGKPMHFGHLRGTLLGHSLSLMHEFAGYKVVRLNYLGDWGTQFGKLMHAYLSWGDKKKLAECPIKHLVELYVRFSAEAKKDEALNSHAREWFSKLEKGDKQALSLWSKFKHLSLDEFKNIYDILGVEFDNYNGEEYYSKKADSAVELIQKKGLAELDQGALIVRLKGFEVPLMLKKSDGSTTYASRDIATLLDRVSSLDFDTLIYVVGNEQSLHLKQVFELVRLLGKDKKVMHVGNGMYLSPEGGKMSTRAGKTVFMEDVLAEALELAKKTIDEKNPSLKDKGKVAKQVAVGAIFFGDLMNDCAKDIVFDLQRILSFEGDTGPYLMYTHARASSIIEKAKDQKIKPSKSADVFLLNELVEQRLVKLLSSFPDKVLSARIQRKPHVLAQYLIELGHAFNEFYHSCPCLQEPNNDLKVARLTLIEASRQVLENGLGLIGISAPKEM